jgi:predicted neuraminidase
MTSPHRAIEHNETETLALQPVPVNVNPGDTFSPEKRLWQGIPGIERARSGRLIASWYSGGDNEGPDNYLILATSEDDGHSWSEPIAVVDPPGRVRAFDPVLWHDPQGRLWWFWSQSYELFDGRAGVWASRCADSSAKSLRWSDPVRLFDGIMMNKPTVTRSGDWLAPAAVWSWARDVFVVREDMRSLRFSNVYRSADQGGSWALHGQADVPNRQFDEHMIVERKDGSLWMLVRTHSGIGEAVSRDGGKTWISSRGNVLEGPCSRFCIRRLQSGRLLLINHYRFSGRNNLTAMLSEDEGRSWYGHLMLDERADVSYPDLVEAPDGTCYVVYDRERTGAKEILLAVFTERDVEAGKPTTAICRLKQIILRPNTP